MAESFKKRVTERKSTITKPTSKEFSIEKWKEAFSSSASPQIEDQRLYEAGLWFAPHFKEILTKFDECLDFDAHPDNLIRFQVGVINFGCSQIIDNFNSSYRKPLLSVDCREVVGEIEAIINAFGSILSKVINKAKQDSRVKIYQESNTEKLQNWLNSTINFGILYHNFEYLWLNCLWHDWYIDKSSPDADIIRPANEEEEKSKTIGIYWSESSQSTEAQYLQDKWLKLPKHERDHFCNKPRLSIKINERGELNFEISNSLNDSWLFPQNPAISFIINRSYFNILLNEPLPNFLNLTLQHIIEG